MKVLVLHNEDNVDNIKKIMDSFNESVVYSKFDNSLLKNFKLMNIADRIIIFYNRDFEERVLTNSKIFDNIVVNRNKILLIANFNYIDSFANIFNYIITLDYNKACDFDNITKFIKSFLYRSDDVISSLNKNIKTNDDLKKKKRYNTFRKYFFLIMFLLSFIFSYLDLLGYKFFVSNINITIFLRIFLYIAAFLNILPIFFNIIDSFTINKDSKISDKLKNLLFDEVIVETSGSSEKHYEESALNRMLYNLRAIDEFYTWSQKQSKSAFILSIILILVGIIIIVGCIVASLFFELEFIITLIGTIGGVIIEFIAGTALVIYKATLSQLNHYHHSLHEDERFLSSVNLISSLSNTNDKDEMLKKIIDSELNLNLIEIKSFDENKLN